MKDQSNCVQLSCVSERANHGSAGRRWPRVGVEIDDGERVVRRALPADSMPGMRGRPLLRFARKHFMQNATVE